jgi:hypothetical protein
MAAARGASTLRGRCVDIVIIATPHNYTVGNHGERWTRDSRRSPFQLPARLADGLGLESGLELCCQSACAPSSFPRNLGLPHSASGRKPNLGCKPEHITLTPFWQVFRGTLQPPALCCPIWTAATPLFDCSVLAPAALLHFLTDNHFTV